MTPDEWWIPDRLEVVLASFGVPARFGDLAFLQGANFARITARTRWRVESFRQHQAVDALSRYFGCRYEDVQIDNAYEGVVIELAGVILPPQWLSQRTFHD